MTEADAATTDRAALVASLWWVAAAMTLHELEEWNLARWSERNFVNHTGISDEAVWLGLVFITLLYVGWIAAATRLRSPTAIALVALPAVGLVAVGNSLQHVAWTVLFADYAPGVVTSALLVLPASLLSLWRIVQIRRSFIVPILLFAVLWIAAVVQIVQAGRVLQPFQLVLHHILISVAEALGLPGVRGAV